MARGQPPTRRIVDSVDELLDGAERLGSFVPEDARSPAGFERVKVDGQPCVVKYVSSDTDFALRAIGGRVDLPLRVWEAGIMDSAPDAVDHATLGMARWGDDDSGCAILMRDLADDLIPYGDSPITDEQHAGFLADLATFSAANWNFVDTIGLLPAAERWQIFGAQAMAAEEALGFPEPVPRIAIDGWARFAELAPADVAQGVEALRHDQAPLVAALDGTPMTFLHGDWKLGNLGRANGRTLLIDWAYLGAGPVAHEIGWYLALNRARLPVSATKESTIEDFAASLRASGIDTDGWWDRQLAVCLLGTVVQFGWEKALGDADELGWWCDRAREGLLSL